MTSQREFIFVYNAKGGKLNYILDTIHKYVSPNTYDCNLCQITYDLKMKKAWKDFIHKTPHIFKFLHLEELREFGLERYENQLPICVEKIGNEFELLINKDEMNAFKDENPERFFQVGIAEANMIGIAAGMAVGGMIPYTGTFANFSTGRVYDQIRQSVAYSNKNVKIWRIVKTLVVPMQGSIGAAVPSYLERTHFDRVMLVHPWSKNGTAHHNASGLADYFRSRLMRFRAKKRDSRETEFEVIAMKCSQKPLEISEYFCQSLRRDYDEKNRESADDSVSGGLFYDVLLADETPVGYIIGTMQLSVDGIPIRCHITSLGH